jgi:hypothetical protein
MLGSLRDPVRVMQHRALIGLQGGSNANVGAVEAARNARPRHRSAIHFYATVRLRNDAATANTLARLQPTSALDAHGSYGRFAWVLLLPEPVTADAVVYGRELPGFDFVEFTPDGRRILRIVGFFGPLASAAP